MSAFHQSVAALTQHGSLVLFIWVAAEQLGAPLPAVPVLVAAGVLSATGKMSIASAMALGMVACLAGDIAWYAIGKRRGTAVLRLLCKISLEPETCVRRSSEFISRHGGRSLLVAKFIPGISAVAVPLAANSGISLASFLAYDLVGSALYVGSYVALGRFVGDRIEELSILVHSVTNAALGGAALAALAIVAWRVVQRRRFRRSLRISRITPEDLRELIEHRVNPFIVDLRHPVDLLPDPRVIPGAVRFTPDELSARYGEIPRDRDVILYCT
jgi:membrane protein DedA with SNARE-associated domain